MKIDLELYTQMLERCRNNVNLKLSNVDIDKVEKQKLCDMILAFVTNNNIQVKGLNDIELTDWFYHDMAEYSFISRENLFEQDGFEELDVNSWNDIDVVMSGTICKTTFSFLSPTHALNVHEKMLRKTKTPFDQATPNAVADIGENIRICALRTPLVDDDVGIISSIRKVKSGFVSQDELISWGTANAEMIQLMLNCLRYGISICVSGETGSGKTTLSGALVAIIAQEKRTVTIEEGSREWQFRQSDGQGGFSNSVVHLKTRPSENEDQNITQEDLVKSALRLNPDFLPIGEVRGSEAFEVMGASNTGHTTITTIHSNGTADTPRRLITLAKKAYDLSDATLLDMAAAAFPILVHIEKCPDNVRRVTEIAEVIGFNGYSVQQKMLYEFETDDTNKTSAKTKLVNPRFTLKNYLSQSLYKKMLKKGASINELKPFIEEE